MPSCYGVLTIRSLSARRDFGPMLPPVALGSPRTRAITGGFRFLSSPQQPRAALVSSYVPIRPPCESHARGRSAAEGRTARGVRFERTAPFRGARLLVPKPPVEVAAERIISSMLDDAMVSIAAA